MKAKGVPFEPWLVPGRVEPENRDFHFRIFKYSCLQGNDHVITVDLWSTAVKLNNPNPFVLIWTMSTSDDNNNNDYISLRHLPDLSQSDASLSFQIPATAAVSADLLLADDSDFLLHAAELTFTTPPPTARNLSPHHANHDKLTLSQLTPMPRPRPRPNRSPTLLPLQLSSPHASSPSSSILLPAVDTKSPEISRPRISPRLAHPHYHELKHGIIRDGPRPSGVGGSPVNAQRFANLKAEVESLVSNPAPAAFAKVSNSPEPQPQSQSKPQSTKSRPKTKPVSFSNRLWLFLKPLRVF